MLIISVTILAQPKFLTLSVIFLNLRPRYKEVKITQDIDNMKAFDFSIGQA